MFEDHDIPADRIVGNPGDGWCQVMSELAFERSAPDRFLSTFRLIVETGACRRTGAGAGDGRRDRHIGGPAGGGKRLLSIQVAGALDRGETPNTEAALVKEVGTALEQDTPEAARQILAETPAGDRAALLEELLAYDVLHTPSFTLRGGAREVVRGIVARGLGLR